MSDYEVTFGQDGQIYDPHTRIEILKGERDGWRKRAEEAEAERNLFKHKYEKHDRWYRDQLERADNAAADNAKLRAEVERMRPVVEAVRILAELDPYNYEALPILNAYRAYREGKA